MARSDSPSELLPVKLRGVAALLRNNMPVGLSTVADLLGQAAERIEQFEAAELRRTADARRAMDLLSAAEPLGEE